MLVDPVQKHRQGIFLGNHPANLSVTYLTRVWKYQVEKITVPMCQQAVNDWFNDRLRQHHRFLNYAGKVLKYAITMQLIMYNPVDGIIIPRQTDNWTRQNIENYYDKQELEHLFECFKDDSQIPQACVFFRLAAFSGMRKSEMLALKWSDVNFKDCSIDINKTQSRGADNRLVAQSPKTTEPCL
nr:site-specific integrase [Lentilactobacillus dabitei]